VAIERIDVGVITYEMPRGLYNPMQAWGTRLELPIVMIADDGGSVVVAQCRGPVGAVRDLIESMFTPILRGRDPLPVRGLWDAMYRAALLYEGRGLPLRVIGALDVALWDLRGQLMGQPHDGNNGSPAFRIYYTYFYETDGSYRMQLRELSLAFGQGRRSGLTRDRFPVSPSSGALRHRCLEQQRRLRGLEICKMAPDDLMVEIDAQAGARWDINEAICCNGTT
jgi:hypothetical protein